MTVQRGDLIVLQAYGDTEIVRRVWDISEDRRGVIYNITTERSYIAAMEADSTPICAGFRAEWFLRHATDEDFKRRFDPQFPTREAQA